MVDCYHCGLPVTDPQRWTVLIQGKTQPMCCPGCQTVAGAIVAGGLENYYQYRSELASKADEPQRKDQHYFRAFDVALLATQQYESVPQSLLQAMFVKTPVIGTNVGGIPEIVMHGKTGLVVEPLDEAALEQAIEMVLTDSDGARERAEKAFAMVSEFHTVTKMGQKVEELIKAIVEGKKTK